MLGLATGSGGVSPEKKGIDLGDYTQVKDRIAMFYELFGQGRLVTMEVRATDEPDGKPRVWVKAAAYRTPDDPLPGIGWSWMELPGSTSFTKGSELENVETSAWGRAIGSLGILILKGIGTKEEVDSKAGEGERPEGNGAKPQETEHLLGEFKDTGTIVKGEGHSNQLEARMTPDGYHIGWKLVLAKDKGRKKAIPQVWAEGPLAITLYGLADMDTDKLLNERAKCTGRLYEVRYPGRRSFHRLRLTAIELMGYSINAQGDATPPVGPIGAVADAELGALDFPDKLPEAESVPLGLDAP